MVQAEKGKKKRKRGDDLKRLDSACSLVLSDKRSLLLQTYLAFCRVPLYIDDMLYRI